MIKIDEFSFDSNTAGELEKLRHWNRNVGLNWPVVYIINNKSEAYIGETLNASQRVSQHLLNKERQKLTEIRIMTDDDFNKSVILDLEAFLIKHMGSDGKYKLQNHNGGLQEHEYYLKKEYEGKFKEIWAQLKRRGVVQYDIDFIENSELFKYSPYKSLGMDQMRVAGEIIRLFDDNDHKGKRSTVLVRGGAGTGKTILGIYLIKMIADLINSDPYEQIIDDAYDNDILSISMSNAISGASKIGLVIPQDSLKTSLKKVFRKVTNLNPNMVMNPHEVVKDYLRTGEKFDLLIVDEAHRLKCRYKGHLSSYQYFDKDNTALGLDKEYGTELDWIMMCSTNQIFFRDELQTVRPCDIPGSVFISIINTKYDTNVSCKDLTTQWRCLGGNNYIDYLKEIFSGAASAFRPIDNYEFKLFDDCASMINAIKEKEAQYHLCRTVAGYAWTWDRDHPEIETIEIQGLKYRWNSTTKRWIDTSDSINEIGCIHTVQGYDLNYCGVIIGEDLKYDPVKKQIYADKDCYYDQQGKSGVANDRDTLTQYLCNIYLTLMTRGIKGTYVYVCNDNLREYMRALITNVKA